MLSTSYSFEHVKGKVQREWKTKNYLHLADNAAGFPPDDKMVELIHLLNEASAWFQQSGVFSQFLSVDE